MKIEIMDLILNPFILIFATVVLGMLFGKIKFGKFSFGTSGAMFVGLVIGWAVFRLASGIYDAGDESAAGYEAARTILETNNEKVINSGFFTASLILFVAAVGLLAAKDILFHNSTFSFCSGCNKKIHIYYICRTRTCQRKSQRKRVR